MVWLRVLIFRNVTRACIVYKRLDSGIIRRGVVNPLSIFAPSNDSIYKQAHEGNSGIVSGCWVRQYCAINLQNKDAEADPGTTGLVSCPISCESDYIQQ